MKTIEASQMVKIPEGGENWLIFNRHKALVSTSLNFVVEVTVRARNVTVSGPRGKLVRNFKHLNISMEKVGKNIRVRKWFGIRKELASVRTVCSHIENMIKGTQYVIFSKSFSSSIPYLNCFLIPPLFF